jgi:hypothetical protein
LDACPSGGYKRFVELSDLRGDERLALVALLKVAVVADGNVSDEEVERRARRSRRPARDIGREVLRALPSRRAGRTRSVLTGDETNRQRELRDAHRLFIEIGATIRAAAIAKELLPKRPRAVMTTWNVLSLVCERSLLVIVQWSVDQFTTVHYKCLPGCVGAGGTCEV